MQKQEYIRASEIGSFLFCEKAWRYNRQGVKPSARVQASRDAGIAFHRAHGASVSRSRLLMFIGLLLLIFALLGVYLLPRG